jgi:hypothetical protein
VLGTPLRAGSVEPAHLAEIQRRREGVTKVIQGFQARMSGGALAAMKAGRLPALPPPVRLALKIPGLRNLPARIVAFGVRRVRVEHP